jgi:hypothetical protein
MNGGSKKGGYDVLFQRSLMLYHLLEVQETSHFLVNDCFHNQAGFLPHQFKDKHSHNMINHIQYRDAALNMMNRVESTSVSSPPTMGAAPAVCVPAAASAIVPAVTKPSVMSVERPSTTNGRFRLGKTPSPVVSAPVVRDAVRIPRKRSRSEGAPLSEEPIVIE